MSALTPTLLTNAAVAIALAAAGEALRRRCRRPELLHLLWLLVLARLLVPPVVELPVLPSLGRTIPAVEAPADPSLLVAASGAEAPVALPPRSSIRQWLPLLWLLVAAAIVVTAARRWWRFRRAVSRASTTDPGLEARLAALAARVGLPRVPRLRVVDHPLAPAVVPHWDRAELLLCRPLVARLSPEQLDALLLHELTHLRRRDHWVRLFELLVTATCWWNPITWWARHRLREAEEQCCDREVVRLLGSPVPYARALVETLAFTRRSPSPLPATVTGAVGRRDLEERLRMLFETPLPSRLRTITRWSLASVGIAALAFFPIRARTADLEASNQSPDDVRAELLSLHQEALALEEQRRTLDLRRLELERQLEQGAHQEQVRALREAAEQMDSEGHEAEAQRLELELEMLERQQLLTDQRYELEVSVRRELEPRQRDARRLMVEAEVRRQEGDRRTAEELQEKAQAMERETERLHLTAERQALEIERQHRSQALASIERQVEAQRSALEERAEVENRHLEAALAALEDRLAELERQRGDGDDEVAPASPARP